MLVAMANGTTNPYIEFKDVCKAFGDRVILDNVSFDVLPGEMVCILGRSGVGKSVTLHNIMGFLKPDTGRVIVAGVKITDHHEHGKAHAHHEIALQFSEGALFRVPAALANAVAPLP